MAEIEPTFTIEPPLCLDHGLRDGPRHPPGTSHVDIEDFCELLVRHLERRAVEAHPRVVHQDVDALVRGQRLVHDAAYVVGVGHIAGRDRRTTSRALGDLGGCLLVAVVVSADDHDVCTRVGDRVREGAAESAVGAGDQGRAALETERIHGCPPMTRVVQRGWRCHPAPAVRVSPPLAPRAPMVTERRPLFSMRRDLIALRGK